MPSDSQPLRPSVLLHNACGVGYSRGLFDVPLAASARLALAGDASGDASTRPALTGSQAGSRSRTRATQARGAQAHAGRESHAGGTQRVRLTELSAMRGLRRDRRIIATALSDGVRQARRLRPETHHRTRGASASMDVARPIDGRVLSVSGRFREGPRPAWQGTRRCEWKLRFSARKCCWAARDSSSDEHLTLGPTPPFRALVHLRAQRSCTVLASILASRWVIYTACI